MKQFARYTYAIHTTYAKAIGKARKQHQDFIETDDKAISEVLNGVVLVMDFYNIKWLLKEPFVLAGNPLSEFTCCWCIWSQPWFLH